jgi:hypothetical protein
MHMSVSQTFVPHKNKPKKSSIVIQKGICETYPDCENVGWPRVTVLPVRRSLETELSHTRSSSAASMVIFWPLLSCPMTAIVVCCCHSFLSGTGLPCRLLFFAPVIVRSILNRREVVVMSGMQLTVIAGKFS